jgi:hypothetical protein
LGELLLRQGKAAEAEMLCRNAADLFEGVKGPIAMNQALCCGTLGEALRQQKKPAEAGEAFDKALSHVKAGHAAGVRTLPVLTNAAKLYQEQGKSADAQKLEKQAATIRDQHKKAVDGK